MANMTLNGQLGSIGFQNTECKELRFGVGKQAGIEMFFKNGEVHRVYEGNIVIKEGKSEVFNIGSNAVSLHQAKQNQ